MSELLTCLSGTLLFRRREASQARSYCPDRANSIAKTFLYESVVLYSFQDCGFPLGGPFLPALARSGLKAGAKCQRSCLE